MPAQRTLLSNEDDARLAATVVTGMAQRVLSICTHDLEPDVYEYPPFLDAVKKMVLSRRFAKVRVLMMDDPRPHHARHAFVLLARKLTSHIEIRTAPERFREPHAFLIADTDATIFRLQHDRWEGICDLQDRGIARLYLDQFDAAWLACGSPRLQQQLRI